jgi:hypothetical protein
MLTSRRDYIVRIIEEVGRLLAMSRFKRQAGADQEALETVVHGFTRLFQLDADQIFLLTPTQHYQMLTEDAETPEFGRDKILLYAALSAEAGDIYAKLGNRAMARATRLNALRFTLKARTEYSSEGLPEYTPRIAALLDALADEPLDPETAAVVSTAVLRAGEAEGPMSAQNNSPCTPSGAEGGGSPRKAP